MEYEVTVQVDLRIEAEDEVEARKHAREAVEDCIDHFAVVDAGNANVLETVELV